MTLNFQVQINFLECRLDETEESVTEPLKGRAQISKQPLRRESSLEESLRARPCARTRLLLPSCPQRDGRVAHQNGYSETSVCFQEWWQVRLTGGSLFFLSCTLCYFQWSPEGQAHTRLEDLLSPTRTHPNLPGLTWLKRRDTGQPPQGGELQGPTQPVAALERDVNQPTTNK